MKGKILSVLFCLMLVFGMIFAACNDGDIIKDPSSDDGKNKVLDFTGADADDFLTPPTP
jgi:hypothetical protein